MSLTFVDVPTMGGGWFKPSDHEDAAAFLIEVKRFERQRPTSYGPKDSAVCDITVFSSPAELEAGTPSEELKGTRVENTLLARDLADLVGNATITVLAQTKPSKPGQKPGWVWRPVTKAVRDKVVAYATKREAEVQAAIEAAPSFED